MGKDYYKILGVAKSATQDELKKAYRKLALKHHPDRCAPDKKDEAAAKFQEIGEAYDCLSDVEKKRVYDQVGSDNMYGGGFPGGGSGDQEYCGQMPHGAGTKFHFSKNRADDIFKSFFGTGDPFAAGGEMGGGMSFGGMDFGNGGGMPGGFSFGGMQGMQGMQQQPQRKADPINHTLYVTLEDIYKGTTKKMRITKKVLDSSGRSSSVPVDKEIKINPGWKDGTKITFACEGDEAIGVIPADIIFTLQTRPHDNFTRDGDDLIHTVNVDLADAMSGFSTNIKTLDGRNLKIEEKYATPDSIRIIPNEGLINNKKKTKGNLKVKYHIIFPAQLPEQSRNQISQILRNSK